MAALVLAACSGSDGDTTAATTTPTSSSSTTSTTALADRPIPTPVEDAVRLGTDMNRRQPADDLVWEIEVTNTTDADLVLTFPTSQIGDAVLLDGEDEVHRWSSGRFFTQEVVERTVPADDAVVLTFDGDLTGVEPGLYTMVLELAVVGPPEPYERSFRVLPAD